MKKIIFFLMVVMLKIFGSGSQERARVMKGPDSGVVVFNSPGFLIADHKIKSQLVYLNLDPQRVIKKHIDIPITLDPEVKDWYDLHIERTVRTIQDVLVQLRKILIKNENPLEVKKPKRGKRWVGVVFSALAILTVIGTVVGTSLNVANSVQVKDMEAKISSLNKSLKEIQRRLEMQDAMLDNVLNVVNETVVIQGVHAEMLSHSTQLHSRTQNMWTTFFRFIDPVNFITQNYLHQLESNIGNLVRAKIPLYFVTTGMVQEILESLYRVNVNEIQISVALEMGSAIPVFVDVDRLHISFVVNLPLVTENNVYLVKKVANVGFWKDDTYFKLQTPKVVVYQKEDEDLYLVPKIDSCVNFKDVHYLCAGKPFLPDTDAKLCGVRSSSVETSLCEVEVSIPKNSKLDTVAVLVDERWLVSSKEKHYRITYMNHGTYQTFPLEFNVSMIYVPKDTLVTIGEVTLFHVTNETMLGAIEMIDLFNNKSIPMNDDLRFMLQNKESQLVHLKVKRDIGLVEHGFSLSDTEMLNGNWWMMIERWCKIGVLGMTMVWLVILTVMMSRYAKAEKLNGKYRRQLEKMSMKTLVPIFEQIEP